MRKRVGIWCMILLLLLLAGCGSMDVVHTSKQRSVVKTSSKIQRNTSGRSRKIDNKKSPKKSKGKKEKKEDKQSLTMKIILGKQSFQVELSDNKTTQALMNKLPMTITMGELNQNEKYYYLPDSLPTDAKRVSQIHTGDMMLYGSDCLVIFYKDFNTSYSYTSIGKIKNADELAQTLGSGKVTVTFQEESVK